VVGDLIYSDVLLVVCEIDEGVVGIMLAAGIEIFSWGAIVARMDAESDLKAPRTYSGGRSE